MTSPLAWARRRRAAKNDTTQPPLFSPRLTSGQAGGGVKTTLPERIHFVGIGGIGMSGLALLLLEQGHRVSGSDVRDSALLSHLRARGAQVFAGHAAEHLDGSELLIYSSCIAANNPELEQARQKGVPIIHRAEALARAIQGRQLIAVSGAHGKTTTTGLIAQVLLQGEVDPTFVIGAGVASLGGHARLGRGRTCVVEADESDGSFLQLRPTIAVVTNLDHEHLDYYHTMEAIKEAFAQFFHQVDPRGAIWACADDQRLVSLAQQASVPVHTFGLDKLAEVTAWHIKRDATGSTFQVRAQGEEAGEFRLRIPGAHNISNALAAIGVGRSLGVPLAAMQHALATFSGAQRRFDRVELPNGITVIDDYAHHPTEIRATLAAVDRGEGRRLVVVFQPHRYTRTHLLREAFLSCFETVDHLVVTDIYPAFEQPIAGVSAEQLVAAMHEVGLTHALHLPKERVLPEIAQHVRPGDIVMLIGAGDIGDLFHALACHLATLAAQ